MANRQKGADRVVTDRLTANRRQLGAMLRRLREEGGKTLEDAAAHLECSPAKVSRIETGQVAVRPIDVREMLSLYEVSSARSAALLALVRQSREKKGWWKAYAEVIAEGYEFFISLEDEASVICDYQPFLVPGLLQTESYMSAVMEAYKVPPALAAQRIALREQRQSILAGDAPPQLRVVIEEQVLQRPVGDSWVMREQLRRLLEMGTRPGISIQVISVDVGLHPAEGRAFVMLGFPDPSEPKIVYLEHLNESHLLDDVDRTADYERVFSSLQSMALSLKESASLIERMSAG
ncbi:helix-turn-helix domain-containing protein [Nonomuraea cavernae]|uniref:Transcriptional regulator n=1 Tax=Nonomuraea cavernae TaxID=2045107 RepID=A0A917YZZ7_9ACTN|nr:helix-turn-helix transcriptional regulator [Nonomuraea cavernae]MCA2186535.1 helix-turn-helix domain-containing protein [Nonomuraea cavernae]GGO71374.1 transcriptional regulator [Nonomuraea cavernae]